MRTSIFVSSAALILVCAVSIPVLSNPRSNDITLLAPDGTTVTINRDSYGVPHIIGQSEAGVFFGQGFAVAQDRLFQMETYRRAAEGRLSEWFGSPYLGPDKDARATFYMEDERTQCFNGLPADMQTMLESYRDGINTYLDSMAVNPERYKPYEFSAFQMEPWTANKSIAVIQYMARRFGKFGGEELERLGELQENGQEWFDQNKPLNDPSAFTTIPGGGAAAATRWAHSHISVREEVIQSIASRRRKLRAQEENLGLPTTFGSFGVLISAAKSASGCVMLLGCPQAGDPQSDETNIFNEVELHCPSFHVGGIAIPGIPAVVIGHTENYAWTITSGYSDNSDVYIDSTLNTSGELSANKYFHNSEWLDFEVLQDTIISAGVEVPFAHYRTIHGPVIGDDLNNHQVFSLKMTFWDEEVSFMRSLLEIVRATNLEEFERAIVSCPLSFNLLYAGIDQKIKFWHIGKYQDRSDGIDPRLPHKGDGSEEWGGFIDFADLPMAEDPTQGYFVNWNNKPVNWWNNGDNTPWIGPYHPRLGVDLTILDNTVAPVTPLDFEFLKTIPLSIQAHGTYQQAIELCASTIVGENVLPPGQSGFVDLTGTPSPHFADQWPLHQNWQFKDMEFDTSLLEPLPDTWTTKANMLTKRVALSCSVVDGIIYAIGGDSPASHPDGISTVEAYDPKTNTWMTKANMKTARHALSTCTLNGKIYAIGGTRTYGYRVVDPVASVEEYDPVTDTWTSKADLQTARALLSVSVANGKIYAFGGINASYQATRVVEEYDPATNTWTRKANMPIARAHSSTSVVDGKIYVIGGADSNLVELSRVDEYDPATDTWARKANMPTARIYLSTSAANGMIYAIGGAQDWWYVTPILATVEEYNPERDKWATRTDMPTGRAVLATCTANGNIYAIGGTTTSYNPAHSPPYTMVSTVEEYMPVITGVESKPWVQKTPAGFVLHQNYPNPLNPATTIQYSLPEPCHVKLSIYNALGQEVDILTNEYKPAGDHRVVWRASSLSSGVYLYRLEAKSFSDAKKMFLLK